MERMKTQVELLKECCDIKDAACVKYQKRIAELEEENKKLRDLKCVPSNLKTVIRIDKENERLEEENKKLKEEIEKLKSTYVYDAKQVRDVC